MRLFSNSLFFHEGEGEVLRLFLIKWTFCDKTILDLLLCFYEDMLVVGAKNKQKNMLMFCPLHKERSKNVGNTLQFNADHYSAVTNTKYYELN